MLMLIVTLPPPPYLLLLIASRMEATSMPATAGGAAHGGAGSVHVPLGLNWLTGLPPAQVGAVSIVSAPHSSRVQSEHRPSPQTSQVAVALSVHTQQSIRNAPRGRVDMAEPYCRKCLYFVINLI